MRGIPVARRLEPYVRSGAPGLAVVVLMLVWAAHDGGYDADTWYWGALAALVLAAGALVGLARGGRSLSRVQLLALVLFALYVGWSYLSITWASYPGAALAGSNRALLYFLLFAVMSILPWTVRVATACLATYVIGIGAIAVLVLLRLAAGTSVVQLLYENRLVSPTGYVNSTAALFTIGALTSTALGSRRELNPVLRGLLLAMAGAELQLAIVVQSRGWLFTLPLVLVIAILIADQRLRVAAAAVLPAVAALVPIHRLLAVYDSAGTAALRPAAMQAGRTALLVTAGVLVVAIALAWVETLRQPSPLSGRRSRVVGIVALLIALGAGTAGAMTVSKGDPVNFISRQWRGFTHPSASSSTAGSHFAAAGSGRWDFWRVALNATAAHPVGGLGQDNYADYYLPRRRTTEEPQWPHSLELRLLASTGVVGFALFLAFVMAALASARDARRAVGAGRGAARDHQGSLRRGVIAAATLPCVVWFVHGSVDWFWELPALSGPALGFLGMAGGLRAPGARSPAPARRSRPTGAGRRLALGVAAAGLVVCAPVLLLPYVSVRDVSMAADVGRAHPAAAIDYLRQAHQLDPWSADPDTLEGAIALTSGHLRIGQNAFSAARSAEPGSWFAWLGDGLASSALGERARARRDFARAASIDSLQPAVRLAIARAHTRHPLTAVEALGLINVKH